MARGVDKYDNNNFYVKFFITTVFDKNHEVICDLFQYFMYTVVETYHFDDYEHIEAPVPQAPKIKAPLEGWGENFEYDFIAQLLLINADTYVKISK